MKSLADSTGWRSRGGTRGCGAIRTAWSGGAAAFALALLAPALLATRLPAQPPATTQAPSTPSDTQPPDDDHDDDLDRKIEIMNSPRWRRAIFELGEWLSSQAIYTPAQVRNIKADFNFKVEKMTANDLEYLLDDLDAKFKILDTPEARDARAWVAQYLSVMSDQKRAETLRDVPNVVTMSASQLEQEIAKIERTRSSLQQQQAAFDASRQQLVQRAADSRRQTAAASAAATRQRAGVSYSPYRSGGGGGKPPFSDVRGSGMTISSGPFGAWVSMSVGNF